MSDTDYESWKAFLEAPDTGAIKTGMKCGGLPMVRLGQFGMSATIGTAERPDQAPGKGLQTSKWPRRQGLVAAQGSDRYFVVCLGASPSPQACPIQRAKTAGTCR